MNDQTPAPPAEEQQPADAERKLDKGALSRATGYGFAILLGLVVAVMGYISSFDNLSKYAIKHGFPFGAVLPLGLDLGTPALLILDWLRPNVFLRTVAWSLAGFTVFANGAVADGSTKDQLLHAMLPAVAILIVEAARHLRDDPSRMDKVRMSRWFLSPVRTARLWRRMVLWEITSYSEALTRESAILHARTVLASAYGKDSWRRTRKVVPLTLKHQLATGQIPVSVLSSPDLQTAVRDWVRQTREELALERAADQAVTGRTEPDEIPDYSIVKADPWDQMWVRLDSLVPDGIEPGLFAQAFAVARLHFQQVNEHISGERLRTHIGGSKSAAVLIAKRLKSAYQSGPDWVDRQVDAVPLAGPAVTVPMESGLVRVESAGLNAGLTVPTGGAS